MRLTQLYDIEKVFSASLEMETLLPVICEKVLDLIEAQAVNLWMVDQHLHALPMQQAGADPFAQPGIDSLAGGGIVGDAGESGGGSPATDGRWWRWRHETNSRRKWRSAL